MIPRLHLVTDDGILAGGGFLARATSALQAGGADVALHLRGPRTSGRDLFNLARALRELAQDLGSLLLINDRVDVALTLDLPGCHLGQRSLPPRVAREILGSHRCIGLSAHDMQEARRGNEGPVDFLIVGTIFPSSSHPHRVPRGPEGIAETKRVSPFPLLAIGGVTPKRVHEVLGAGAHGVAVRGGVWEAEDSGAAVGVFLDEIRSGAKPPVEGKHGTSPGAPEGEG